MIVFFYKDRFFYRNSLEDAIQKLEKAAKGNLYALKIVIQTKKSEISRLFGLQSDVVVIPSLDLQIRALTKKTFTQS